MAKIQKHRNSDTRLVSDGDSKTFLHLQNDKVYGEVNLLKEECINHLQKRMGTALRNVEADERKHKVSLGGKSLMK